MSERALITEAPATKHTGPPAAKRPTALSDPASVVLVDVLHSVRVASACYGQLDLSAPWGVRVDALPRVYFVALLRGHAWLEVGGAREPTPIGPGDLVVLPHGDGYVLRDDPASPPVPICALLEAPRAQYNLNASLIGGALELEDHSTSAVLRILPAVLLLRRGEGRTHPWLDPTLQLMAHEKASERPGAPAVITRLASILFIQAVRAHLSHDGGTDAGWLRGLSEPKIGTALALIHENPDTPWTVESLARRVGMSRSSFAARFAALVGEPPLHYLTRLRMHKASALLRDRSVTLAEVADRAGYRSESAFSKAFKRWMGMAPGAFREQNGPA